VLREDMEKAKEDMNDAFERAVECKNELILMKQ